MAAVPGAREQLAVQFFGLPHRAVEQEVLDDSPTRVAEPPRELPILEQPADGVGQGRGVARRARVVAYGTPPAVASPCSEASDTSKPAPRHWAWAALMRRAFDVKCWRVRAVGGGGYS
jgi:hypothetical protein